MADKKLYILHFPGSEAAWLRLEGTTLVPVEAPPGKTDAIILALLPDQFFFFIQPNTFQTKSTKALIAASRLQLQHAIPPLPEGWEMGLLRPLKGRILGFVRRPELEAFIERHQAALSRARAVTTSFILAWHAAQENSLPEWSWEGAEGERSLAVQDLLFYCRAETDEMDARSRSLLPPGQAPVQLNLAEILADLHQRKQKWSHLRLPTKLTRAEDADLRPLVRTMAVFTLIGFLFILGQIVRLNAWKNKAAHWRTETNTLYSLVLGPDLGADPYGKLLFTLDQLSSGGTQGFDVFECLAALSREAPESLTVESLSVSGDSGVVSATVKTYDQVDKFMEGLKGQTRFQFTLDQATNTDKGVKINLRVASSR